MQPFLLRVVPYFQKMYSESDLGWVSMNKGLHTGLQGALIVYAARRQAKAPDSVADNKMGLHMVDMCSHYYMRYSHCIQNMAIAVLHASMEVSL
jgi:hypothetical protein